MASSERVPARFENHDSTTLSCRLPRVTDRGVASCSAVVCGDFYRAEPERRPSGGPRLLPLLIESVLPVLHPGCRKGMSPLSVRFLTTKNHESHNG